MDQSLALRRGNDGPVELPLEDWQAYVDTGPAHELLCVDPDPGVVELASLRKDWPKGLVAVAVEAARARMRAMDKFHPELADRIIADEEGVMVASSALAASHKAARFVQAGAATALDLCCGIGAVAYELGRAGLAVTGVDRSPVRAWMAWMNAHCEQLVADVEDQAVLERVRGAFVHLDPSRRTGSKRTHAYEDYQPGPETIERIIDAAAGACVKLGPGVDFPRLPTPPGSFVELLGEFGRLTQALLWTGTLAANQGVEPGHRVATRLPGGERFAAEPGPLIDLGAWYDSSGPERPVLEHLYEADPALERGSLLGAFAESHGLRPIHPAVGVLTGEKIIASPWLTRFGVLEAMPWRRKAVKARLRELGAGIVAVKTRAKLVDPDALQKDLRGPGDEELTLFVLRLGDTPTAIITRRATDEPSVGP